MFILVKLFFTADLIVLITDVAKRSNKFGGLIAAMPIITILAILWMYFVDVFCGCILRVQTIIKLRNICGSIYFLFYQRFPSFLFSQ